ncbi:MAG: FHA domain-containing protein, partial [Chloroflexi bacterium]
MIESSTYKFILSDGSPKEFELTRQEVIIGRDPSVDLTISSPAVSRRHARVTREGDGYVLEDLGSSNGTFVNEQKLSGRRLLRHGDQIRLGHVFTLIYDAPALENSLKTVMRSSPVMSASAQTMIGVEPPVSPIEAGPPQLVVTIAGETPRTHTLTGQSLSMGRMEDSDIVIHSQLVSRQHARLEKVNGGYQLMVLPEAKNPILFEGRELDAPRMLRHGDILRIGSLDPGMMVTITYNVPGEVSQGLEQDIVFGEKTLLQIGREPGNDVVLPSPSVSRFHAQVERVGQRYRVEDLRSANGTFVNGERIDGSVWLKPEDTIRIGQFRFVMGRNQLAKYDDSNGLRVDVIGLNKWVRKDLNILQNISVSFKPREFIVVVGQSGGGKSTFVDAVAGYRPATPPSRVLVNDIDIYSHFDAIRNDIGFVPQKDIIHMELTIYQALDYAAQLRMPA